MSSIDYRAELTRAGANVEGRWSAIRFLARRYPLGAFGAVIMALCVFAALFAPFITVYDPLLTNAAASLARPSAQHWLGCDFMGRDVYSRIVYGARISLAVGLGSLSLGLTCGVLIGLTSGYLGGWIDLAAQRLIDILQSLPLLVMALLMTASLGPSLRNTIIAISIALIPSSARVVRSTTLSLREQPFVEFGEGDRHGPSADRLPARAPQYFGAADRAGHCPAWCNDLDRGDAVVSRAGRSRAASLMGAHVVGIRPRNTSAPRRGW